MKKIGFLSFGHWTPSPQSQTRSAADPLLQSIDLAVAAEALGADGAYFRVHHFARQLASPFPLLSAVGAKTSRIEIGTAVIDMRYENPLYMVEDASAADLIAGGRLQLGISRGSPEQVINGWRYFGYRPAEGQGDAEMGRGHAEVFLDLLRGEGFAQPNPRPMFPNPPGLLRIEPHSEGLRERIWWGAGSNATAAWAAKLGVNLQSSTLKSDESGEPFHIQQAAQIRTFRSAWKEAGHAREPSCPMSLMRSLPTTPPSNAPPPFSTSMISWSGPARSCADMMLSVARSGSGIATSSSTNSKIPTGSGQILFRIAADDSPPRWQDSVLREGALFMVGDPKQAIYRFWGADVGSYAEARSAIARLWPGNIIQITANFRSRPVILTHINRCFAAPLSSRNQPGYVELAPTLDPPDHDLPCAAKITIDVPPESRAAEIRDAEAEAVADLCARLIGNVMIRNEDGELAPLAPGGIALLAPTGSELWRYERAFEARGLPIASQAGKGLFRRQEVQDLVALARVLADGGDNLAFGALMRGSLVGLSEEELLDITAGLPPLADRPDAIPRFSLATDPDHVTHPVARRVLTILQDLRRRARATTPALLLAEAVERLAVRPILRAREGDRSARAAANVEALLERARPYGVKGMKRFARDVSRDWRIGAAYNEGRADAEGDAIEIITIHSAKGLEWPVVIPINTATLLRSREAICTPG